MNVISINPNQSLLRTLFLCAVILLAAGCASLPKTSFDGLIAMPSDDLDELWVRPGFDPQQYSEMMFRGAGIHFEPMKAVDEVRYGRQTQFPIDPETKNRMEEIVVKAFAEELRQVDSFQIVNTPSAQTLLLTVSLIDVASHIPPQYIGRHEVYFPEVGTATLVLEFRDAKSGAILVRGTQRKAAERYADEFQQSRAVTNWTVVQRLAQAWAQGLKVGIDDMKQVRE